VNVQWSPWNGNKPSGTPVAIPTAILGAALPLYEQERETLQRGLATGWGPWLHSNMLALVSLPSCGTVTTSICKKGSSATADCIDSAQPDGHKQNARSAYVRVGHHAYDRSYVQFFVAHSTADSLPVGVNASIEYTVSNGGKDIDILVSPVDGGSSDWKDVELVLDTRFAFFRAGVCVLRVHSDYVVEDYELFGSLRIGILFKILVGILCRCPRWGVCAFASLSHFPAQA